MGAWEAKWIINTGYGNVGAGRSSQQNTVTTSKFFKYVLTPSFAIIELRKGSPAERAGLKLDDVIIKVNNKDTHHYTIQQVTQLFYGENGKRIKLIIDRNGVLMKFSFQLESLF